MSKMTVAEFLSEKIEGSAKTQYQIAKEVGFEKPNIITMIKQGKTKLPLAKIVVMARALDVDPAYLLRITIQEYLPELAEVIEGVLHQPILGSGEVAVVHALRDAGIDAGSLSPAARTDLARYASALAMA